MASIGFLPAAESDLRFNRDVKPILAENCLSCHGPDPGSRKGGIRLDTKEGLFGKNKKDQAVVVPGHPGQSELWRRLVTTDEDDLMPPKESHKVLSDSQKTTIKRWIELGASWQPHWAFVPPERPPVPPTQRADWVRNPIDAFILHRLEQLGLSPAPPAERRELARRAALDLTGLPPDAKFVEALVRSRTHDAYQRFLDSLFRSPHYGEHRARYWLDAARYADTHGLHFDNYREMWPYRDWVIRAFNGNLPFDRFTILQLAGDLLPEAGQEELIATGFHRCALTTNEAGSIEAEILAHYARERVETTSAVWLGLTAGCASCHDHKFDPITTKDFYSMEAFFRNTTQGGFDGNIKNSSPSIPVIPDQAKRDRWTRLQDQIGEARKQVEDVRQDKSIENAFESWLTHRKADTLESDLHRSLIARIPLQGELAEGVKGMRGGKPLRATTTGELETRKDGKFGPAWHWKKESRVAFKELGDFGTRDEFSISFWAYFPSRYFEVAPILGRMEADARSRGWEIGFEQAKLTVKLSHAWPHNAVKLRSSQHVAKLGVWQHLCMTYDGSGQPEGVRLYLDGRPVDLELHKARSWNGPIKTSAPLRLGHRSPGQFLEGGAIQDLRFFSRPLLSAEVISLAREFWKSLLEKPLKEWKSEEKGPVLDYFLAVHHEPFRTARSSLAALETEQLSFILNYPVTHVQKEKMDSEPMAHVLFRGQYDKPREKVKAATFQALPPIPQGAPTNRLGLAQWLVNAGNPLTARVTVNRMWQEVFGVGLIRTSDDFGIMGERPSHPELLDWLAVEFRESGWNMRHLYTLMMTSATYRQSAASTPQKNEKDPANRFLSRGPRFRMDAEMIRDYALATSGLLSPRIGGESVKPYQPPGVWEAVAMPESNTRLYLHDSGSDLYRRSLYTFWKRAAPPASMDLLNAPSREVCTVRRERTNTPLQALVTMNDPQFVEAARHLAARAFRASRGRRDQAIQFIARQVLLRSLDAGDLRLAAETYDIAIAHYRAQTSDAMALLEVGESPGPVSTKRAPELAALAIVANQLLNLDETLNK